MSAALPTITNAACLVSYIDNTDNKRRYLMIRRHNDSTGNPVGDYYFAGGRVDAGETPAQAALRELKEETNFSHPNINTSHLQPLKPITYNHTDSAGVTSPVTFQPFYLDLGKIDPVKLPEIKADRVANPQCDVAQALFLSEDEIDLTNGNVNNGAANPGQVAASNLQIIQAVQNNKYSHLLETNLTPEEEIEKQKRAAESKEWEDFAQKAKDEMASQEIAAHLRAVTTFKHIRTLEKDKKTERKPEDKGGLVLSSGAGPDMGIQRGVIYSAEEGGFSSFMSGYRAWGGWSEYDTFVRVDDNTDWLITGSIEAKLDTISHKAKPTSDGKYNIAIDYHKKGPDGNLLLDKDGKPEIDYNKISLREVNQIFDAAVKRGMQAHAGPGLKAVLDCIKNNDTAGLEKLCDKDKAKQLFEEAKLSFNVGGAIWDKMFGWSDFLTSVSHKMMGVRVGNAPDHFDQREQASKQAFEASPFKKHSEIIEKYNKQQEAFKDIRNIDTYKKELGGDELKKMTDAKDTVGDFKADPEQATKLDTKLGAIQERLQKLQAAETAVTDHLKRFSGKLGEEKAYIEKSNDEQEAKSYQDRVRIIRDHYESKDDRTTELLAKVKHEYAEIDKLMKRADINAAVTESGTEFKKLDEKSGDKDRFKLLKGIDEKVVEINKSLAKGPKNCDQLQKQLAGLDKDVADAEVVALKGLEDRRAAARPRL